MANDPTRTVLLRSMAAVAGADGKVGDREVAAIGDAYREVTGSEVPLDELRATVEAGWEEGGDPVDVVSRLGGDEPLETRLKVAEACYRVLEADGEITGPEAHTFNAILKGLGLSRKDVLDRL